MSEARRRAIATLGATVVCALGLGLIGLDVEERLHPTSLAISGTDSDRGEALAREQFGESSPVAVMLTGPAGAVERQGRRLVAALRADSDVTAISPWDPGPAAGELPAPAQGAPTGRDTHALILLDFHIPLAEAMRETVPALERMIDRHTGSPVEVAQSGYATISRAIQAESLSASERAELYAAPLLLIVLLLVFRSILAALIPLAFGALTVIAGRGVLVFLTEVMPIDAISLVVCTMMGLALGVDYSLLIVSRFREELAGGFSPTSAAARTRISAGRTTAIAGATLFFSIFLSAFFQPGTLLISLAAALAVVTAIAVIIAWAALPALLALLGPRINAGRIGRPRPGSNSAIATLAASALRRPAIAAVAIGLPLLALSTPAFAFNTGSPGVDELASSSQVRIDSEAITTAVGGGWQAPFILTLAAEHGPMTEPRRLHFLDATERKLAETEGVESVIGPGSIAVAAAPLGMLAAELGPSGRSPLARVKRLGPHLSRTSGEVAELRDGLVEAAAGGALLGEGTARAGAGAELIAGGLGQAGTNGGAAAGAIGRIADGSEQLAKGQRIAAATAYNLSRGFSGLLPGFDAQGLERAKRIADQLGDAASGDPAVAGIAREAEVLATVLSANREELSRLRSQARDLDSGLRRLEVGGERLRDGSQRLAAEASGLSGDFGELHQGADRLVDGLAELRGGAEALSGGLAAGAERVGSFQNELEATRGRLLKEAEPLELGLRNLEALSPGFFESGFLAVAALDGATRTRRSLASGVINVSRGGNAARFLVVPASGFNTPGSRRLDARLRGLARELGERPGYVAGLAGGAAVLNDHGSVTKSRLPLVIGAIVAITFLMLVALLRAPLLAALAVVLNLLSVAAAIGVVSLACKIPAGYPLGGHPYIDTIGAAAIFGVTFGLSIDYAVFLLARMREKHAAGADNAAAIRYGLEKTAGVITGAAAIMAAVFASFAVAPVATVSQMGLGLTVAILLDATVVRIVLLPAMMLLIGERVWRTPAWLARLLPGDGRRALGAEGVG